MYDFEKIKKELVSIKTKFIFPKYIRDYVEYDTDVCLDENEISPENGEPHIKQQGLVLSEEQMDLLAKKISKEMEKVLKKLLKEKKS